MGKVTKVTVEIDTTNAAFEEGNFQYELKKALANAEAIDGLKILDGNGDTIGTVKVETG